MSACSLAAGVVLCTISLWLSYCWVEIPAVRLYYYAVCKLTYANAELKCKMPFL